MIGRPPKNRGYWLPKHLAEGNDELRINAAKNYELRQQILKQSAEALLQLDQFRLPRTESANANTMKGKHNEQPRFP